MKRLPRKDSQRSGSRFSRELAVLYEDDSLVAVNKPAGLLAVPVKGSDAPSALSVLTAELRSKRQQVFMVHRIDRFTSGIMLFAKSGHARDALIQQFLTHTPVRRYLAVVRGHLSTQEGMLVHYLRRRGMFQELTAQQGREAARAELRYSVQRSLRAASLIKVMLVTGLQNQIRVQFAAIGHPVIGDRKYCPEEASERRIARVALHAQHLEFIHPRSGERVSIDSEPPADFQALVRALRP